MITAREAVQLYDESGHEVDQFLKDFVEKPVTQAAMSGKRRVYIFLDSITPVEHLHAKITPLITSVVAKLRDLGYLAVVDKYGDPYVPRALADDDGNGPLHMSYGIKIEW